MKHKLAVLPLLVCAWASAYPEDRKSGMFPIFGEGDFEFITTLQTIESPANRWKPGEEPLPIDLTEFARKAKQHLLRRRPDIPAGVNLMSTELRPFAITTVSTNGVVDGASKPQKVAWYLVFNFSRDLPGGKRLEWQDCTAAMMLDGTILEMTKRKKP